MESSVAQLPKITEFSLPRFSVMGRTRLLLLPPLLLLLLPSLALPLVLLLLLRDQARQRSVDSAAAHLQLPHTRCPLESHVDEPRQGCGLLHAHTRQPTQVESDCFAC